MTVAPTHPAESRQLLEALYLELTAELELAQAAAAAVGSDRANEDEIDAGSRATQQEQQLTLVSKIRGRRAQVEIALQRLADGTYGLCSECGTAIAPARLEAFPQATECVACKQTQERRD